MSWCIVAVSPDGKKIATASGDSTARIWGFSCCQFAPIIAHVPPALLSYPFKAKTSAEAIAGREKVGGFIKGVCHGREDYDQMKAAGIEWNRCDIPFPFDASGNVREDYVRFKTKLQGYVDNGMKIMAVTPYPREFIAHGIDPRLPENEESSLPTWGCCFVTVFYWTNHGTVVTSVVKKCSSSAATFCWPIRFGCVPSCAKSDSA